ncbi:hypothetical protein KDJ56_06345 [Brevibacillus composti]|uniref:Uncharacterized protein n=1 Tax=Brevibacillus composti TaxID=2796470 RepID=A0A7T5EN19_9BACL|nr:hypothetical protein [Brevibacillus composti]QQE75581.1 hypothetical protein JD108_06665 [Brevibacillus composti]QUO42607.1 hypothetical protein KDJ56_06345 [Brevibacillus composti]
MDQMKKKAASNHDVRREETDQPRSVQNDAPGYGNKKLEGPNRPST